MKLTYKNSKSPGEFEDRHTRETRELKGPLPDYCNPMTQASAAKFGNFIYDKAFDDGIKLTDKGPVELDN